MGRRESGSSNQVEEAMEVPTFRFAGYGAGDDDFGGRLAAADAQVRSEFDAMLDRIASLVASTSPTGFAAITVIGYSDQQDTEGMSCNQRRQSEEEASTDRAVAAWEWIKAAIEQRTGASSGPWWDESPNLTWALIGAGATRLPNPNPTSPAQRAENRRVTLLVSEFPSR